VILVDTQADPGLYSAEESRRAVDLLCSNALAAALEFSFRGIDVLTGHTGGKSAAGNSAGGGAGEIPRAAKPAELPAALAWPAALPLDSHEDLPDAPGGTGVLILSLPRLSAGSSALDRYLNRNPGRGGDIFFLYDTKGARAGDIEKAAAACVFFFNGKQNVTARHGGL
jgi:hypothetical protein